MLTSPRIVCSGGLFFRLIMVTGMSNCCYRSRDGFKETGVRVILAIGGDDLWNRSSLT